MENYNATIMLRRRNWQYKINITQNIHCSHQPTIHNRNCTQCNTVNTAGNANRHTYKQSHASSTRWDEECVQIRITHCKDSNNSDRRYDHLRNPVNRKIHCRNCHQMAKRKQEILFSGLTDILIYCTNKLTGLKIISNMTSMLSFEFPVLKNQELCTINM